MRTVDLFCGCGGMSLGFQMSGHQIVGAFDCWQPALDCYAANMHLSLIHIYIAGRAPEHAPRGRADLQHLAAVFIEGDDGRLAQHDAAPGRIDQHVGRAEIDPKVSGKE